MTVPGSDHPVPMRLEELANEREALDLRSAGMSYREIGAYQGVSGQSAHRRVTAAIKAHIPKEQAEEQRAIWADRTDLAVKEVFAVMVKAREAGDLDMVLKATAHLVRLGERAAKLYGFDKPVQAHVTVTTQDQTDAALLELLDQMIGNDPKGNVDSPSDNRLR